VNKKWPDLIEWIFIFTLALILLAMFLLLPGCASGRQAGHTEVIWHDGDCMLYVKNTSVEKAKEMTKGIKFEECNVTFEDDLTEGEPQ